ncbi:hypothetical protein PHMEG_0008793 [Phytophthora megakarya]|uniref:Uncharacterized protein n=1 Tax=Phytophthora megakarya TaxID=4795 RepID=A0A225WIL9_9STRA|nr:hypothetical protein PHMEG_0008793 [Phytophthora megakarya]
MVGNRDLRIIRWYLCDRFRDTFVHAFCNSTVWPFEVVNSALNALTLESFRLLDRLTQSCTIEDAKDARSQLTADLKCLAKYFTAWNESKRVIFIDNNEFPGSATVLNVEEYKVNAYRLAKKLQTENIYVLSPDRDFYAKLSERNMQMLNDLFSFAGERFDTIKFRNQHKIVSSPHSGMVRLRHEVSVSERDTRARKKNNYTVQNYQVFASAKSVTLKFEHSQMSPFAIAQQAGAYAEDFSTSPNCEVTKRIILPVASCMCDIVMKVQHKAFCYQSALTKDTKEITFRMCVPEEKIKPTFVPVSFSSLMDLLMGQPVVRIEHGANMVSLNYDTNELNVVPRENRRLFKLHPAENGSLTLSVVPFVLDNSPVHWVCVRDGKLVVSHAEGCKFSLIRLSTNYNDWILQEYNTSKYVCITTDGAGLCVKEENCHDAASFSFVRPLHRDIEESQFSYSDEE